MRSTVHALLSACIISACLCNCGPVAPPPSPKVESQPMSTPHASEKPPEHAVIVTLRLSDDQFGSEEERDQIHILSDKMERAIIAANAGEFDGDEFGDGKCTLYMYGPNADELQKAIEPILKSSPLAQGATLTKRYGEATDLSTHEETIRY